MNILSSYLLTGSPVHLAGPICPPSTHCRTRLIKDNDDLADLADPDALLICGSCGNPKTASEMHIRRDGQLGVACKVCTARNALRENQRKRDKRHAIRASNQSNRTA